MQNLYTETLLNFLKNNETSPEWQSIIDKFNQFPKVMYDNLDYDMYSLFKQTYGNREIGAEDEEVFYFNINNRLNIVLIEYLPKIKLFFDKYPNCLNRVVAVNESGNQNNKLYPVTSVNGQNYASNDFSTVKEQQILIFKSDAEILKTALELKNIYLEALNELGKVMLGVY